MKKCLHEHFEVHANIGRLSDIEGGPVVRFVADITIRCAQCKEQFSFVGVPHGSHPEKPMVSFDGTELHAPITPGASLPLDNKMSFTMPKPARRQQ